MTKKKKIIVLVSMVLLLVVTTTLNIVLGIYGNKKDPVSGGGVTTTGNFFTDFRTDREATRDQQMLYLDSILNNEALSESAKAEATAQKLAYTKIMEIETILEGALKANGYADAVVSISSDSSNVYVFLKSPELTSEQSQAIFNLIMDERKDIDMGNIRITPVE